MNVKAGGCADDCQSRTVTSKATMLSALLSGVNFAL